MLRPLADAVRTHLLPTEDQARRQAGWYLAAALVVSITLGLMLLPAAFRFPWIAAVDTRQHVCWMLRFADPGLFPGDPHADYFQAISPFGFAGLYRAFWTLGVDPVVLSKLLPMAIGGLTTFFVFRLAMRVYPVPAAAFVATLLFSQYMWMNTDMPTGTPRSFLFPALAAFLDALVAGRTAATGLAVAATALTYPQFALVELATLAVWAVGWSRGPRLRPPPPTLAGYALVGLVGVAGLGLYAWQTAPFGPVVTLAQARTMAEFQAEGFRAFFDPDPVVYWLSGFSTGYLHNLWGDRAPAPLFVGLALPVLLAWRWPWADAPRVGPGVEVLWRLPVAATALYLAAHATLFRLYLPARYTSHPLALVLAIAAGIVLVATAGAVARWAYEPGARPRPVRALALAALLAATGAWLAVPFQGGKLPDAGTYKLGRSPSLYRFLLTTPKHARIATLTPESGNLPMFARRQVLIAETMNPYHLGFYLPIRRALLELIEAHYSPDRRVLESFLRRHAVDYLLVDRHAFEPAYFESNRWLKTFRVETAGLRRALQAGQEPAMKALDRRCVVYEANRWVVFDAAQILAGPHSSSSTRPSAERKSGSPSGRRSTAE